MDPPQPGSLAIHHPVNIEADTKLAESCTNPLMLWDGMGVTHSFHQSDEDGYVPPMSLLKLPGLRKTCVSLSKFVDFVAAMRPQNQQNA